MISVSNINLNYSFGFIHCNGVVKKTFMKPAYIVSYDFDLSTCKYSSYTSYFHNSKILYYNFYTKSNL